jgi:hypothetical protein
VKHRHVLVVALMFGAAAAAGLLAATRTVDLGRAASTPAVPHQAIQARAAKLDRLERSLQAALDRRPPKLPPIPKVSKQSSAGSSRAQSARSAGGVTYVRPAATVVTSSSTHDSEYDHESEPASGDD